MIEIAPLDSASSVNGEREKEIQNLPLWQSLQTTTAGAKERIRTTVHKDLRAYDNSREENNGIQKG